jgi:O-antigen/teichoic acid export membrane protein
MINILKINSKFIQNIFILLPGTFIGIIIPLATLPVLTRLLSPDNLGIFATYMAYVGILGVLSAGRLDMALILPRKDKDALGLLIIGLVLSFIIVLLLYLVIFILYKILPTFEFLFESWYYFVPIGMFLYVSYLMLISWHNRKKNYKLISKSRIIQSASISFAQIFITLVTKLNFSLILGDILGKLLSIILIIKRTGLLKIKIKKVNYIKLLKKYNKFPLLMVPASLINVLSHQMPIIVLPLIFSSAVAGLYFLAIKVAMVPTYFLGTAILEVFKNKAQDDLRRIGSCRAIFIKTGLLLFSIAVVPALLLFFFGPTLFSFVFGPEWREAGEYAKILAPLALVQFVCSPLSYVLILRGKLFFDLKTQILFFILILISLMLVAKLKSIVTAVWLLMISGVIFYLITIFFSYKFAKKLI